MKQLHDDIDHVVGEDIVFEKRWDLIHVLLGSNFMQPFLHDVFENFIVWRHSKEQLENDGSEGIYITFDGNFTLLLVEFSSGRL